MHYSSSFYYSKKIEKDRYSYKPEGTPDLDRLIRHLPWWRKSGFDSEQTPKALIFADWTSIYYTPGKIEKVKKSLLALLDNQFKLFIWNLNTVKPLLKADLTNPAFNFFSFNGPRPASEETILKMAINDQRLVQDQCLILDYYWIDYLCFGQTERLMSLNVLEDVGLDSIAHQASPPLTGFTIDLFVGDERKKKVNKLLTAMSVQYPLATYKVDIKTLILDDHSLLQLMTTGTLNMGVYNFSVDDLPRVEMLRMNNTWINIKSLEGLLEKAVNLESLVLDDCLWSEKSLSKVVNLPHLKTLYLEDSGTPAKIVEQFLLGAVNLETLHWSGSYIDGDKLRLFDQEFFLPRLVLFYAFDAKFSGTTLRQLLAHSLDFHLISNPHLERGKDFNNHDELMTLLSEMPVDEEISNNSLELYRPTDDFDFSSSFPGLRERFDVDRNFNNKPYPLDSQFQYQGIHGLRNQRMIIEKLSQFLIFFRTDQHTIARLQNGICYALSRFFLDSSLDEWNLILNAMQSWNGRHDSLSNALQIYFFSFMVLR